MGRQSLPVIAATLFALANGMFWAVARLCSPGSPSALGDPGAYIIAGMLGAGVLISLAAQDRRIRELEERLRDQSKRAEPGAAPERGAR